MSLILFFSGMTQTIQEFMVMLEWLVLLWDSVEDMKVEYLICF